MSVSSYEILKNEAKNVKVTLTNGNTLEGEVFIYEREPLSFFYLAPLRKADSLSNHLKETLDKSDPDIFKIAGDQIFIKDVQSIEKI